LEATAEHVDDGEQKTLLRRTARVVGGVLRDVAVNVASNQFPHM
jgi:hypothetical protein